MKEEGSKFVVAIIDDDENIRSSLSLNLELEGFKVVVAEDGDKGLDLVRKDRPDIIILDVLMPKKRRSSNMS